MKCGEDLIGGIYPFGGFNWLVLDTCDNKALLLLEHMWQERPYHFKQEGVTWEDCTLRKELNDEFYNLITQPDRDKIAVTHLVNNSNPWYKENASGGNSTNDHVFLLSIEEAVRYFGDSGELGNRSNEHALFIDDEYNSARKAVKSDGAASWWWLRSPGANPNRAARVFAKGRVHMLGSYVSAWGGFARPALWINL